MQRHVVREDSPDLPLILDLPVEQGLGRAIGRNIFDRFEAMDREFHEKLRQGFLAIAAAEQARCVVLDAAGDVETVAAAVWAAVGERLGVEAR